MYAPETTIKINVMNIFITPKSSLVPFNNFSRKPCSNITCQVHQAETDLLPVTKYQFVFPIILYTEIMQDVLFFCLAFFIQHNYFTIHPCYMCSNNSSILCIAE